MAYASPTARSVGDPVTAADQNIVATDLADSGWSTASLGNSWVSFDGGTTYAVPRYRKCGLWVEVDGEMKSGTLSTAFTLPVGYRPEFQKVFLCASGTGSVALTVLTTGAVQVTFYTTGGSNASVALVNIKFMVAS